MALFSQNNEPFTVIVRGETVVEKSKSPAKASESDGDRPSNQGGDGGDGTDTENSTNANRKYKYKLRRTAERLVAIGLGEGKAVVSYSASAVGMMTGDSSLQNTVNRRIEMISDPLRTASSTAMTAYITESPFLGLLAGTLTLSGTVLKYMKREREYNIKVFMVENEIAYNRNRAGVTLDTGRLR